MNDQQKIEAAISLIVKTDDRDQVQKNNIIEVLKQYYKCFSD